MSGITVRKYDWRGRFRYAWQGEVAERDAEHVMILAIWQGPGAPNVGEITFSPGDRFLEYYYPGRGYAIWQVERPNGEIKGWYCNISTPVQEQDGVLTFNDLLLDVLVYPDGRWIVLDRDEFDAARRDGLAERDAREAEAALDEVVARVRAGTPPFSFTGAQRTAGQS